ncbi:acyl-CoA thioesterase [Marivita sp. S6314]|uniref:acyl-CoA thioesterase n=1 Tax=Marivita sp. S6314 TaxID=2926406 RepID=UPI001FF249A5|nr:acyl-CoA thioesterase [Marivita sp. S6314]MCK0148543.1 acyl-CoA thioesterase [Marivita sp. S6314]
MPAYTYVHDVMLRDCEPSGIVFLPRYFDMVHTVIENWLDEALDWPMSQIQGSDGLCLPFVDIKAEFPAPSRLGDRLTWRLAVRDIGRSSIWLEIIGTTGAENRVSITGTLVLSEGMAMRTRRWPEPIVERMKEFMLSPDGQAKKVAE